MPAEFLHSCWFERSFCDRWILVRVHIRIKAQCYKCLLTNCGYFKPVLQVVKCFVGCCMIAVSYWDKGVSEKNLTNAMMPQLRTKNTAIAKRRITDLVYTEMVWQMETT